ncbi:hypothetical protein OG21DRAFT_1517216 [Imleria badia]|nr:hypothetical protein OG21DRAFT_1517216 [Imleria badia]
MAPSNRAMIDLEQGRRQFQQWLVGTWFSGLLTLSLLLVCIRASCRLQRFYLSLSVFTAQSPVARIDLRLSREAPCGTSPSLQSILSPYGYHPLVLPIARHSESTRRVAVVEADMRNAKTLEDVANRHA